MLPLGTTDSLSWVFLSHVVVESRVREVGLATGLGTKFARICTLAILLGLLESGALALVVLANGLSLAEAGFVLGVAHFLL